MKKRIFIAMHYMELGGAERALLGLLEALSENPQFEVDLFVYRHQGELMKYIPQGIRLLPENSLYACYEKSILSIFLAGHFLMGIARLWAKISNILFNHPSKGKLPSSIADEMGRATNAVLPSLSYLGEYDLAIGFLNPHYYLIHKVFAKKKIGWFHSDYSAIYINSKREFNVWNKLDFIAGVSEASVRSFNVVFPQLSNKTIVLENRLPANLIKKQALEFDADNEIHGSFRLLTIGRFSHAKNFAAAVEIMAELCKIREDVMWYVIGYGGGEAEIRSAITRFGVEDRFIILGKKTNPYPYIRACDLYVQPSLYEGKSISVQEAQLLGKPVAITNYPSAASQIRHGVDGYIFSQDSPTSIAKEIHELLNNTELMASMAVNGAHKDFYGTKTISFIESLLSQTS